MNNLNLQLKIQEDYLQSSVNPRKYYGVIFEIDGKAIPNDTTEKYRSNLYGLNPTWILQELNKLIMNETKFVGFMHYGLFDLEKDGMYYLSLMQKDELKLQFGIFCYSYENEYIEVGKFEITKENFNIEIKKLKKWVEEEKKGLVFNNNTDSELTKNYYSDQQLSDMGYQRREDGKLYGKTMRGDWQPGKIDGAVFRYDDPVTIAETDINGDLKPTPYEIPNDDAQKEE